MKLDLEDGGGGGGVTERGRMLMCKFLRANTTILRHIYSKP